MQELWFWIVSVMLAMYVVMDGFDLGAGALHLVVARTDQERRSVLNAIGPFWDGNEVWLLAAGGALFLSFPQVLASGFSGFYLALFLVLWCLILRGITLEFRSHVSDAMWRRFFDGLFWLASSALPILFGAALGNVLRGVPIDATHYFELPLFTDFAVSSQPGILDWYTILVAVFALAALVQHGALFLAWKTSGPVQERSRRVASLAWVVVLLLWIVTSYATAHVVPSLFPSFRARPLAWVCMALAGGGIAAARLQQRRGRDLQAFLGSAAFLLGFLAATAACVFPVMLRSTLDPAYSLTAHNASSSEHGLLTALGWWVLGFPLAILYLVVLFRIHRGKVDVTPEGEGY
jgi:cytochrome d ubiquinol oxidase subunit II